MCAVQTRSRKISRRDASSPSRRSVLAVSALLFAVSATATIVWCASMSAMSGMPMAGGWTMSMTWMRMPEQTWLNAATSFAGMWIVMMVAMMLPSLVPMLWRYRQAVDQTGSARLDRLMTVVGAGYFFVWALVGLAAFPVGVALASIEMQQTEVARAVPMATSVVVLIAGALQFTPWKAHRLDACGAEPGRDRPLAPGAETAWRHGWCLGIRCASCCGNLMAVLLANGVMDLGVMAVVTAAITFERLSPASGRGARVVGMVLVGAGLWMTARLSLRR